MQSLMPSWVGWLLGALVWAGVGVLWLIGNSPDDMRPLLIGIAGVSSAVYLGRGVQAYRTRHEPPKPPRTREDPDAGQLLILALVGGLVIASVVLGFQVLSILNQMQR